MERWPGTDRPALSRYRFAGRRYRPPIQRVPFARIRALTPPAVLKRLQTNLQHIKARRASCIPHDFRLPSTPLPRTGGAHIASIRIRIILLSTHLYMYILLLTELPATVS